MRVSFLSLPEFAAFVRGALLIILRLLVVGLESILAFAIVRVFWTRVTFLFL